MFIGCPDGSDPGDGPGEPTTNDDTTPPVIALTGEATITLELGGADFVDEGATVTDNDPDYGDNIMAIATIANSDGNTILTIDTSTVDATYTITYTAPNDAAGNTPAAVTRTVTVADTMRPIITLTGEATIEMEVGATVADPGATVRDNDLTYAGTVTATTTGSGITITGTTISDTTITGTAVGTYTITYTAPNDAGDNPAVPVTRTVRVLPRMTLDSDGNGFIDINTLDDLNAMRHNLAGNQMRCGTDGIALCMGYELLRDLDFAEAAHYDSGMVNPDWRPTDSSGIATSPALATNPGWDPIGEFGKLFAFSAHFNGNGNTISNLYVRRSGAVGLFGVSHGTLDDIGIVNARLYGEARTGDVIGDSIGGLVGQSGQDGIDGGRVSGTIINSYATGGSINGGGRNDNIGGLIGVNFASTVTASYATGMSIDGGGGGDRIGGLIGLHSGSTVINSYATGDVDGGTDNNEAGTHSVGGLIGSSEGSTVTASYATGDVDGGTDNNGAVTNNVGGLIGRNDSAITASYATGDVSVSAGDRNNVGGLVGYNRGAITTSYATGNVDGGSSIQNIVGGLIGDNDTSPVTASYATGDVSGAGSADRVGSLVGISFGTITASYGFGTETGEPDPGVTRSDDASPPATVADACDITRGNSSTMTSTPDNRWVATQWDFGTGAQRPLVRHNNALVPGQTDRGCI